MTQLPPEEPPIEPVEYRWDVSNGLISLTAEEMCGVPAVCGGDLRQLRLLAP